MSIVRLFITFLMLMSLGACSIYPVELPDISNQPHRVEENNPIAYSCNEEYYQVHYCDDCLHNISRKYFRYAVFSSNAYDDQPYIFVPGWNRIKRYKSRNGFVADLYENVTHNGIKEVVIAFRGADSLGDWPFANLAFFKGGQYKNARSLLEETLENPKYNNIKITVTGHSLGGGLALHLSSRYEAIDAYVFDPSPRIFAPSSSKIKDNSRVVIREKGEVLYFVSLFWWFGMDKIDYERAPDGNDYLFDFFKNNPIGDHSSYSLARGLVLMAAANGEPEAIEVQRRFCQNFAHRKVKVPDRCQCDDRCGCE